MEKKFKTLQDHKEINLVEYVKEYVKKNPETQLLIGTDSQNQKRETVYAIVIALYRPGKGAHCIYSRFTTPRQRYGDPEDIETNRLLAEVWFSVEVAEAIKKGIGLKAKYIDIDINPDKMYKSNVVLSEAIGLVVGMGYEARWKKSEKLPMITYAADNLVK